MSLGEERIASEGELIETGLPSETRRIIGLLITWKVAFFLFVACAVWIFPGMFSSQAYWSNFHYPQGAPPDSWTILATWDAQGYLHLARDGYQPGEPASAYFPGWPLAIRAGAVLFGGNVLPSALVLASLFSIAAVALLYRFVLRPRMSQDTAETVVLLLIAYPGALFFQFPYSESLFLLLAVIVIAALEHDRWAIAGVAAFALPLVRSLGAFIVVAMAWALYKAWRTRGAAALRLAPWLLAPVAGVGVYFAFMAAAVGDPLAGIKAQDAYLSSRTMGSLVDVPRMVRSILDVELAHSFQTSFLDRAALLAFFVSLVFLWKKERLLFWYALPIGLAPAMTSLMSYTRYLAVLFPVFVAGGVLLSRDNLRQVRWVLLGLLVAVQALLVLRHINFYWAG